MAESEICGRVCRRERIRELFWASADRHERKLVSDAQTISGLPDYSEVIAPTTRDK